jgi:long-chain acyl-CoA synthetase
MLTEGYGLTEAGPVTHCNPLDSRDKMKEGSIGIPLPDTDAKIVSIDDPGQEMPLGEVGELAVKGPQVMKGYWKRPEETGKALKDGWLMTGDIAKRDAEGYFTIVDRKKDMINVGGFKVWPSEVEAVLLSHPAVKDAAVIGVPDSRRGEGVKAYIALRTEVQPRPSADDLRKHCTDRLAGYKVPETIEFREELPKTMIGKVLRRELRKEAPAT